MSDFITLGAAVTAAAIAVAAMSVSNTDVPTPQMRAPIYQKHLPNVY